MKFGIWNGKNSQYQILSLTDIDFTLTMYYSSNESWSTDLIRCGGQVEVTFIALVIAAACLRVWHGLPSLDVSPSLTSPL